jgi:23S rRNA (uracil1939-C5)-methyltransferase
VTAGAPGSALEPGAEVVVDFDDLAPTGEAIARVGGHRLVVFGALPGERARVRVLGSGQRDPRERTSRRPAAEAAARGELVEILKPSPHRITPRCRHAGVCGGCSAQHVAYPEQLRLKRRALESLLRAALGPGAPQVAPVVGMPVGGDGMPWGFRQKAGFVFGPGAAGAAAVMGHFVRGSHEVVPVVECPVHAARANRIAFALRDELARAGLRAFGERDGVLRHLLVRTTADEREAAAVLVVARDHPSLRSPLRRALMSKQRPDALMLNLHDRPGPYMLGRETVRIEGQGHVREERLGPSFLVSPTGFFQTNVWAAAEMLRLVGAGLPRDSGLRVLDLYSGSGLFALPLAQRGHRVTAVEESRKASRDAGLNARLNGVPRDRLRLVCSRVEDAIQRLARERFDAVILDPPRQGCPPRVLETIARRLRPERLILVSCNPEALARELSLVLRADYRALSVQPLDMFPHTPHIETVAVLTRRASRLRPRIGRRIRP